MHVPLADQLAYYRAHPPRAIGALRATPSEVNLLELMHRWPMPARSERFDPSGAGSGVAGSPVT